MSPKAPYRNNTSVTIICEVARVNPPLKGDRVTLSIGRDSYGITKVRRNSDMTWRYTTTKSYYITRAAHDRKLVTCSAKTRGGASRKLEKTARLRFISWFTYTVIVIYFTEYTPIWAYIQFCLTQVEQNFKKSYTFSFKIWLGYSEWWSIFMMNSMPWISLHQHIITYLNKS